MIYSSWYRLYQSNSLKYKCLQNNKYINIRQVIFTMSSQTQASKYNSPQCAPAAQYYNHFLKTFLKPHGKVDKLVSEKETSLTA